MKIGVDLRVLQIGHQYRGIGEVAKRSLNRIFELAVKGSDGPSFVFYLYDDNEDPKRFLTIPKGLEYKEVGLGVQPLKKVGRSLFEKVGHKLRAWYGNPIPQAKECDVFLQFDYALGVPRRPKTVLIKHDIIPYIFWDSYFSSSWVHFKHRAARTTLRNMIHNYEYKRVLRRSLRAAWRVVCVSDHTRSDLRKYMHIPDRKMSVVHLGVSEVALKGQTSGELADDFPTKPFLLFIGAVDARRRAIDDLVAAYNNLKAGGHDIQLVLAGENFQSPKKIPNEVIRKAVMESSYADDILTLGYIDDYTKQKLFRKAIAFVFPTTYEGFGIPVLESMLLGCPVITYKNSSIPEVGGRYAFYAEDWSGIWKRAEEILAFSAKQRGKYTGAAQQYARQFSWDKTGELLFKRLVEQAH